jgi:hypothetical protein
MGIKCLLLWGYLRSKVKKAKGEILPILNLGPRNEDVWGNEGVAPPFLTLALNRGEWSASHAGKEPPVNNG